MTTSLLPVPKARFLTQTSGGGEFLPLSGGKVWFYQAGTSTLKDTYTDFGGLTANRNPVILDANGEANIWLGTGRYKVKLTDSADVEQWTVDNVSASGGSSGVIQSVDSIAALRALEAGSSAVVEVLGYYQPPATLVSGYTQMSDCGGGLFYWDADSTLADDTGVIIIPNTIPASGRWVRVFDGNVSINWFGAVPNYILDNGAVNGAPTNNTSFINAACTFARGNNLSVRVPSGVYSMSGALNCAVSLLGDKKPQVATSAIYGDATWGTNTSTAMEGPIFIWDKATLTTGDVYLRNVASDLSQSVQFKNIGFMSKSTAGVGGGTLLVSDAAGALATSYNFGNLPAFENVLIMNFGTGFKIETSDNADYNNIEFKGCEQAVRIGIITTDFAESQDFNNCLFLNCGSGSVPSIKIENAFGLNFNRCRFAITSEIAIRLNGGAGLSFNECYYQFQKGASGPGGITSNFLEATAEASANAGRITFYKCQGGGDAGDIDLSLSPVVPTLTIIDSDLKTVASGTNLILGATLVTELGFVNYGTYSGTGNNNKVTTDDVLLQGLQFTSTGVAPNVNRNILTTTALASDNERIVIAGGGSVSSARGGVIKLYGIDAATPGDITLDTKTGSQVVVLNSDDSSSDTTGAFTVVGGVGIEKKLYVGSDLNVSGAASANSLSTTLNVDVGTSLDVGIDLNIVGSVTSNLKINTANKGVYMRRATTTAADGYTAGTVALAGGTQTVTCNMVTANSMIFLSNQDGGGAEGFLHISARTPAMSFTITSSNAGDSGLIAWWLIEPT